MIQATIDETDTKLRELIDAALGGQEVFVTIKDDQRGRVVQLYAFQIKPEVARRRRFGSAKGLVWTSDDFHEPLEEFEGYKR